jgi:hypothetical protein
MLQRIMSMIAKDLRTSTRDQISLYILLSPILIALLLLLVIPIFEDQKPQFVATRALAERDLDALAAHGHLELVDDRAALERRVLQRDDITGIVPAHDDAGERPGAIEIIVQGDEPEQLAALPRLILEQARLDPAAPTTAVTSPKHGGELRRITAALLGFSVSALLSLLIGLTILEETTTKTYLIYDVSPLRFGEYLVAKLALLTILSLVLVVPAVGIPLGFGVDWLAVASMVLAGTPFAACIGLLVGVFAKDQLNAVALIKGLSPVWTSLPILGFVLPDQWMWTQFVFANHWAVQGLFHALADGAQIWTHAALSLATGLPVLAVSAWLLRRKLGFGGS